MLKNNILALTLVVILSACSNEKLILKGVDGSAIPPAFASFPDIPFPEPAYIDMAETRTLGSGNNWSGSLIFTAPYSANNIYDFYISEMPKLSWSEVAVVRAKISHMTYLRDRRAVQILIERLGADESLITITAIPNDTGVTEKN